MYLILYNGNPRRAWNWLSRSWAWDIDGDYTYGFMYKNRRCAMRRRERLIYEFPGADIDVFSRDNQQRLLRDSQLDGATWREL